MLWFVQTFTFYAFRSTEEVLGKNIYVSREANKIYELKCFFINFVVYLP
jgi:hypothetical protein